MSRMSQHLLTTTLNTLVGAARNTIVGEACIITYALGCKDVPRREAKARLNQAMLAALIKAWRDAHRLKLFGHYFLPPKRVVWREPPTFWPDPEVKGGYLITCRVGFEYRGSSS